MGSYMAHLNCFSPGAAGVNFWIFIAVPTGGGCWYKAKYDMQDAAMKDRRWNQLAKLWIFREIAKWRRWCHRFLKRWHVVDTKKLPAMTRQPSWSIEIPQFTFIYVYKNATNAPAAASRLTAASGGHLKRHIAEVRNIAGNDRIDRNSVIS